jgi:hypothetical protein
MADLDPFSNSAAAVDILPTPRPQIGRYFLKALSGIASLRLTVVLFVFAFALVFFGTIAQMDSGNWTVVNEYFRTAYVFIPFQLFVRFGNVFFGIPKTVEIPGKFPFPGGWLIGGLLLANLLAAHLVRFKLSWKRSGILILHAGLIVMMVSELVTGLFAVEQTMTIETGNACNFVDVSNTVVLAISNTSDPKTEDVVEIPGSFLAKGGVIEDDRLPVDVEVMDYSKNSDLKEVHDYIRGMEDVRVTTDGRAYRVVARSEESGVDPEQRENAAVAHITLRKKGTGEEIGTYLVSLWFDSNFAHRILFFRDQQFTLDGKTFAVALRQQRDYKPYTIHLEEFHHDLYPGTDKPKNFSSVVHLTDSGRNEQRDVTVSMNDPLRYGGETFYQSGWIPGDRGTILQVVRNPGWLMPYISCAMVAVGMLIHFGLHLVGFLRMRAVR